MRDDLKLAAYAVALGYTLAIDGGRRPFLPEALPGGVPSDGLSFHCGKVEVWETSRGWRVSKMNESGVFPRPEPREFFKTLRGALEAGAVLFDEKPHNPRDEWRERAGAYAPQLVAAVEVAAGWLQYAVDREAFAGCVYPAAGAAALLNLKTWAERVKGGELAATTVKVWDDETAKGGRA